MKIENINIGDHVSWGSNNIIYEVTSIDYVVNRVNVRAIQHNGTYGAITYGICDSTLVLIKKSINTNKINMNLKEKFALAFKGEPERSFIEAGVMNLDESLTTDGQSLFLAFLLKHNGAKFKEEIVDVIIKTEKTK